MTPWEMLKDLLRNAVDVRIENGDRLARVTVVPSKKVLTWSYVVRRKSPDHDALAEAIKKAWELEKDD